MCWTTTKYCCNDTTFQNHQKKRSSRQKKDFGGRVVGLGCLFSFPYKTASVKAFHFFTRLTKAKLEHSTKKERWGAAICPDVRQVRHANATFNTIDSVLEDKIYTYLWYHLNMHQPLARNHIRRKISLLRMNIKSSWLNYVYYPRDSFCLPWDVWFALILRMSNTGTATAHRNIYLIAHRTSRWSANNSTGTVLYY